MIIPTVLGDGGKSETYGLESSLNWSVTDSWALTFGYSYFKEEDRGDTNNTVEKNPQHQFNVQSNLNLPYNLQLDTYAYYVDDMKETDVDDYVRLDMRLGWQATEAIALSLVGQNLLENSHEEWNGFFSRGDRVPRAGYVKMDWQF